MMPAAWRSWRDEDRAVLRRRATVLAGVLGISASAAAQQAATRPAVPLARALEGRVGAVDAVRAPLSDTLRKAAQLGNINLVVNWTALGRAGVKRDAPVSVHLHNLPLEDVLRALLLAVPARGTALNYVADDNVVEVTTNAQIARGTVTRLYEITPLLLDPLDAAPSDEAVAEGRQRLRAFLSSTLANEGEPVAEKGLVIDGNFLAVVASPRGQGIVRRTVFSLEHPTPPGQLPSVAAISVAERRAREVLAKGLKDSSLRAIAGAVFGGKPLPADLAGLNFVLLPGAAEALQEPKGELKTQVTPGGIVCIGTAAEVKEPLTPAVFDVRNLLRRLAARSGKTPAPMLEEFFPEIQQALAKKFPDLPWGKLENGRAGAAGYHGLLLVIAPAELQRDLAIALRGLYKE